MANRVIFHIDMNAYFCSCEEIINPSLKGKPFAVGSTNPRRGVISTASYEARKYGVGSGMSTYEVMKKCPGLILVGGHYELYAEYSHKFMAIFNEYTSLIEQASIDEAYLDVTDSKIPYLELAKLIQTRIKNELGLPCSIGIGSTTFIAKMGSDMKKPMGITIIRNSEIKDKLFPLPIKNMFGIGKKTYPRLQNIGINTIGDLLKIENIEKVKKIVGEKFYFEIQLLLSGKSNDIVDPNRFSDAASIGNSRTYLVDIINDEDARIRLLELAKMVSDRMAESKVYAKTVTVQIRYTDFKTVSKGQSLNDYIYQTDDIFSKAYDIFDILWNREPIRLLGITCSNFKKKKEVEKQINLFNLDVVEKDQKLIDSFKSIENKYGKNVIRKGVKIEK